MIKPSVERLQQTWTEVAHAFSEVADTCIPTGDPMQTAIALRVAATALSSAANEFEIMYRGMIQGE
jgi:hypothetical protein